MEIQLMEVPSLYLVVLRFRFPPMNLVQEAPNILTYIPFHADSLLLFADVVKDYGNADWRFDFVKISYFRKFDREYPRSLKYSKEYGVTLSSVGMPVLRRDNGLLELYLPTRYPRILSLILDNDTVSMLELRRSEALLRQEKLWIRKRDDISKLALLNTELFEMKELRKYINVRSGGYRAIDLLLKIPLEYLSIELAFFVSVSNYKELLNELNILKRSGVGKKRDMGFGDLISWKIYKVKVGNRNLGIWIPMVLYSIEGNTIRVITLRNLPASILDTLRRPKQKGKNKDSKPLLLPVNMKIVLSRIKPPYWLKEELCLMPFSEFLLRVQNRH